MKPSTDQHTLIDLTNDSDDGEENKALVLTSLNQDTGNWHVPQSQSDSRHISDRKEMKQRSSRASVRQVRLRNRARRELLINNINLPYCRKKWCFMQCHGSVYYWNTAVTTGVMRNSPLKEFEFDWSISVIMKMSRFVHQYWYSSMQYSYFVILFRLTIIRNQYRRYIHSNTHCIGFFLEFSQLSFSFFHTNKIMCIVNSVGNHMLAVLYSRKKCSVR